MRNRKWKSSIIYESGLCFRDFSIRLLFLQYTRSCMRSSQISYIRVGTFKILLAFNFRPLGLAVMSTANEHIVADSCLVLSRIYFSVMEVPVVTFSPYLRHQTLKLELRRKRYNVDYALKIHSMLYEINKLSSHTAPGAVLHRYIGP